LNTTILGCLSAASESRRDKPVYYDESGSLTFGELQELTESIGTFLASRVAPEQPVAVMSGRNIYTPAAYLGVLQAGCFYAPMDADMPDHRLNQILGVLRPQFMIADREHAEKAKSTDFDGELFILEDIMDTPADRDALARAKAQTTEISPMYIIFTSGSTGVPKGVITSHYSLMCYLDAIQEVLHLGPEDVLGNQSPLDYIAAIRDMYLPVMTGASTVIIPKNKFAMPDDLFATLNAYKVTTLCWSCAGLEVVTKMGGFEGSRPEYLNKIVFSGSVISNKQLRIWQENLPDCLFVNQYGPTETTASCTYYVLEKTVEADTVIPIGVPYKHYSIVLLGENNEKVPDGETGEICVKGPALALGYYGNAEATAKSFPQNPLNDKYQERIYRTGDFGRIGADGLLYFGGRMDRQVKHMGHRIELEEIEAEALQIDGVEECCALYNKGKSLLYLFYRGEATSKDIVLRFREDLPAFMAPRKLVQMDELPHLPNGKLDMQTMKQMMK